MDRNLKRKVREGYFKASGCVGDPGSNLCRKIILQLSVSGFQCAASHRASGLFSTSAVAGWQKEWLWSVLGLVQREGGSRWELELQNALEVGCALHWRMEVSQRSCWDFLGWNDNLLVLLIFSLFSLCGKCEENDNKLSPWRPKNPGLLHAREAGGELWWRFFFPITERGWEPPSKSARSTKHKPSTCFAAIQKMKSTVYTYNSHIPQVFVYK